MKTIIRLLLIVALGAGCNSRSEPDGRQGPVAALRIGYSSLTPLHTALGETLKRTDILARHGLKGEFLRFERGRDQHAACSQGQVDVTFSCEEAAMIHLDQLPGLAITGSPGSLGRMALVVRGADSDASLADIRRVALLGGASAELALESWVAAAGLPMPAVWTVGGRGEEAVSALLDGRVDGALLWDPWLSAAVARHGLAVVEQSEFWSLLTIYPERLSGAQIGALHAALVEALGYLAAHRRQVEEWTSAASGLEGGLVGMVLDRNDYATGRVPPSLALGTPVMERLLACERHARERGLVSPAFRLSPRLQLHQPDASSGLQPRVE